ncbi:MAG: sulfatase-like hydrolase/transferase [Myxococcales bacterium]|nr:sulfatase-like hydrolase/transferase [Myxococcales bacterium]
MSASPPIPSKKPLVLSAKAPPPPSPWQRIKRFVHDWSRPTIHPSLAIFGAMMLFALVYRLRLIALLFREKDRIFGFRPEVFPAVVLLKELWHELILATFLAGLVWLACQASLSFQEHPFQRWIKRGGWITLHFTLFFLGFLYTAHYMLMVTMQTGLMFEVVMESFASFSAAGAQNALPHLHLTELVFVFLPIIGFWTFYTLARPLQRAAQQIGILLLAGIFFLHTAQPYDPNNSRLANELRYNPLFFVLSDSFQAFKNNQTPLLVSPTPRIPFPNQALLPPQPPLPRDRIKEQPPQTSLTPATPAQPDPRAVSVAPQPTSPSPRNTRIERAPAPPSSISPPQETGPKQTQPPVPLPPLSLSPQQMRSVAHVDPVFADPKIQPKYHLPPARKQRWNVLMMVMESTGTRYIYTKQPNGKPVMPFLSELMKKSRVYRRHFSPSNSSPRSYFSIFSGLYPTPRLKMFSLRKDLAVPAYPSFTKRGFDHYLINPSSLNWYFPYWMMQRAGHNKLIDYYKLPIPHNPSRILARHEVETARFFLKHFKTMKEPFWATYTSFIPHYPYTDYGPEYRPFKNIRSSLARYYNNLYLLDRQFETFFQYLKKTGKLERTIIVITGDHGEAFGQHRGNYTHSRHSYNENFETPLILYQPKLFRPGVSYRYTSHVDILPTLLDAMGISYNRQLFQGESLFSSEPKRRYIFLFGNENTISAISRDHIKVQYSLKRHHCWAYNLKEDPSEKRRLSCDAFEAQRRALLLWSQYQPQLLQSYNQTSQRKQPFFGQKHP